MFIPSFGGNGGVWYFYYVHGKSVHTVVLVYESENVFSDM